MFSQARRRIGTRARYFISERQLAHLNRLNTEPVPADLTARRRAEYLEFAKRMALLATQDSVYVEGVADADERKLVRAAVVTAAKALAVKFEHAPVAKPPQSEAVAKLLASLPNPAEVFDGVAVHQPDPQADGDEPSDLNRIGDADFESPYAGE